MKANDYAQLARGWLANPPAVTEFYPDAPELERTQKADVQDIQCEVVRRLFAEVKEIAATRRAKSPAAIGAIMEELKLKWYAICQRLENNPATKGKFNRDTFMALVHVYNEKGNEIFVKESAK